MSKTLTFNEINQIKIALLFRLDKAVLRSIRANFVAMDDALKDKLALDTWTAQDRQDLLDVFGMGCSDSSSKICMIVLKEFRDVVGFDDYKDREFCRCCLFCDTCSGSGAKGDDQWHHNIVLIWTNIVKDFDLDAIRILYNRIDPTDLPALSDIVEAY